MAVSNYCRNFAVYTECNDNIGYNTQLKQHKIKQELISRWDSERELFYNIVHVEASAYAHWTSS